MEVLRQEVWLKEMTEGEVGSVVRRRCGGQGILKAAAIRQKYLQLFWKRAHGTIMECASHLITA